MNGDWQWAVSRHCLQLAGGARVAAPQSRSLQAPELTCVAWMQVAVTEQELGAAVFQERPLPGGGTLTEKKYRLSRSVDYMHPAAVLEQHRQRLLRWALPLLVADLSGTQAMMS